MKKYILLAAALFSLASCNKGNAVEAESGEIITLTATVNSPATRVAPDSLTCYDNVAMTFHWQDGDQVLLASEASASAQTQLFTLRTGSISTDGKTARFRGAALDDMSAYVVFYAGKNTDETTFRKQFAQDSSIVLDNAEDNCNIMMSGSGTADGFTLDTFTRTLRLQLTGNDIVLGSLKYYLRDASNPSTTVSFGENGLTLSSTATEVWVPVNAVKASGFSIRFYDKSGNMVMEKTTSTDISTVTGTLLFPVLVPVAKTGGVRYFTLADAIGAAVSGATVELLTDISVSSVISINKNISLDAKSCAVILSSKFNVAANDTLTIVSGKFKGNIVKEGEGRILIKGGIWSDDPSDYLAMGYMKVANTEESTRTDYPNKVVKYDGNGGIGSMTNGNEDWEDVAGASLGSMDKDSQNW